MKNRKQKNIYLILFSLVLIVGVAYAILQANLQINGTTKIGANTWDVHFKANTITPTTGSVTIDTTNNEQAATIDNASQVSYVVKLAQPGDFYEFTVDVENTGSIDAMLDSISSKIKIGSGEEVEIIPTGQNRNIPSYLDYSVAYSDGTAIAAKQELLGNGGIETIKVRVEFKTDIEANDLPQTDQTITFKFQMNYVQKDDTSIPVGGIPSSFSTDEWSTIIRAVKRGDISTYSVGDTKTVDLGTFGTHTLRVANTSTPSECSTNGFSQTACGFVLEFADIITTHQMNPYNNSANSNGDGNKGGWKYSDMRAYLNSGKYLEETANEIDYTNGGIYNALPSVLKNAIIDTTVVSGYGQYDSTNFTTTDKLYLLSPHEVWEDVDNNTSGGIDYYDTAYNNTRQLDYYKNNNVTTSSCDAAKKKNGNSYSWWWLRSAYSNFNSYFFNVRTTGNWGTGSSNATSGVSPAFRIA